MTQKGGEVMTMERTEFEKLGLMSPGDKAKLLIGVASAMTQLEIQKIGDRFRRESKVELPTDVPEVKKVRVL